MADIFKSLPPADDSHPLIAPFGRNPAPTRIRQSGADLVIAALDGDRRPWGSIRIAPDGVETFEPAGDAPPIARASFGTDRSRIIVVATVSEALARAASGGCTAVSPARPEFVGAVASELAARFGALVEVEGAPGEQPSRQVQTTPAMIGATAVGAETSIVVNLDTARGQRRRKATAERADDGDAEFQPPPERGPEGQPAIAIVGGRLPEMADQAVATLADPSAGIYRRGAQLVRPVRWSPPPATFAHGKRNGGITRPTGAMTLGAIDDNALIDVLTRRAAWFRFDGRSKEWVRKDCPASVAATILARRGDGWRMPPIKAVIRAPTFRPDGTVLDRPGYDAATHLLLESDLKWPAIPDAPTRQQGRAALDALGALLAEFPFVSDVDRSAALAALVTPLCRPTLANAPLFAISAPTPGTGKSLIVDLASILATGLTPTLIAGGADDESELEKRVTAALLAGDPIISIDNVNGTLKSDFLCAALSQAAVNVRPLGSSNSISLANSASWYGTGNNLRVIEDLRRRSILIKLDARCENPQDRVFERDVVAFAKAERVKLVTAALTAVRSWVVATADPVKPLGGFEAWSDMVRSALMWLGQPDPLGNAAVLAADDPVRERAAIAFRALSRLGVFTVTEVARRLPEDAELAEALTEFADFRRVLDVRKFGWFLRKHRDQNIGSLTLSQIDKSNDVARWRVA